MFHLNVIQVQPYKKEWGTADYNYYILKYCLIFFYSQGYLLVMAVLMINPLMLKVENLEHQFTCWVKKYNINKTTIWLKKITLAYK